jgi:ABC-type thiamin/hydroxymethylpyrimidine transport system permease subunit
MNKLIVLFLSAVFGLFFLAFGVYGTVLEFKVPPVHTTHLGIFIFLILLGSVIMPGVGTIIFAKIKDGVGLAGPYLPTFGRRASQGEVAVAPPSPDAMPGEGK